MRDKETDGQTLSQQTPRFTSRGQKHNCDGISKYTGLVVVLKQLNDHFDVVVVVLDGDDSQDVGRVLGVRVLTVLVRQHQTRVRLFHLNESFTASLSHVTLQKIIICDKKWRV